MKTLFLMRHAKSSRDEPSLPDVARPLSKRGERDAPKMGRRLARHHANPDLIVSSPAKRALATAKIVAKELGYARDVVVDDRLYPGRADELLGIIHALDDRLSRVMIVGHVPAILELAQQLSSEITSMPTAAVAQFAFDAKSWAQVAKNSLASATLDYPKKSHDA